MIFHDIQSPNAGTAGTIDSNPLFIPDWLSPAQYYDQIKQSSEWSGEKRLMLALLEDAIRCYQGINWINFAKGRKAADYRENSYWLFDDPACQPFTFLYVCEHLNVDPGRVRQGLRKAQTLKQQIKRRRTAFSGTMKVAEVVEC